MCSDEATASSTIGSGTLSVPGFCFLYFIQDFKLIFCICASVSCMISFAPACRQNRRFHTVLLFSADC